MRDILSKETAATWGHSNKTLSQVLNLIKLSHEKLTPYKACTVSHGFQDYLFKIFWIRHGLEWEHIKKCPETE